MGHEAWQMIGRTPGYIVAVRPLRKGAITDFDVTQRMIRLLLQRAGVSRFNRPRVVICVPSAITEVERRAVTEAARRAGRRRRAADRAAHGRRDRGRAPDPRADREHGHRRRRRHHRDRGHLARRHRGAPSGPRRVVRHRHRASRTTSAASTASPSASAPPRRSRSRSARRTPTTDELQAEVRGPRPHERAAEDGDPLARGGAAAPSTSRCRPSSTRSSPASARRRPSCRRTSSIHGHPPRGRRRPAARPRPAHRAGDEGPGAPRRRAARVRRARRGSLHRALRRAEGHVPRSAALIFVAVLRCASAGSCSFRSTIGAARTRAAHCAAPRINSTDPRRSDAPASRGPRSLDAAPCRPQVPRTPRARRPAPSDRRLVGRGGEHRGETGRIADRAQRRDGCLSDESIAMRREADELVDDGVGLTRATFAECPCRGLDDRGVPARREADEVDVGSRDRELRGPCHDTALSVLERDAEIGRGERVHAPERAKGGRSDCGGLVGQRAPCGGLVAGVPRDDDRLEALIQPLGAGTADRPRQRWRGRSRGGRRSRSP